MSATSLAKLHSSTSDVSQASSTDNMSSDKKNTKTSVAKPPVRAPGSGVSLKVPKRERHPSGKSEGKTAVKSASSSPKKPAPVTTVKKDKKPVPVKSLPRDSSKKATVSKNSGSSNLSFSELKKQHQVLSKDVEDLTQAIQENEEKHQRELSEWQAKMSVSESTIAALSRELEAKKALASKQDAKLEELRSQLLKTENEKERLVMVIESCQKDALTGRDVHMDSSSWEKVSKENSESLELFTKTINRITSDFEQGIAELQDQHEQIKQAQLVNSMETGALLL